MVNIRPPIQRQDAANPMLGLRHVICSRGLDKNEFGRGVVLCYLNSYWRRFDAIVQLRQYSTCDNFFQPILNVEVVMGAKFAACSMSGLTSMSKTHGCSMSDLTSMSKARRC